MKIFYLTVALLCICLSGKTTNYYFSASAGDDSRSSLLAQNTATPWKSLQKLNTVFPFLQPGDSVLFKRGDVFYGKITATASGTIGRPIVFAAFGTGSQPVINGFEELSPLRSEGGKIWSTPWNGLQPNVFLLNGRQQALGRFPNSNDANGGYLTFESHNGTSSITDNELSPVVPFAAHVLYLKEAPLGRFRSQVPALILCQSLIISLGRRIGRSEEGLRADQY